MPEETAKKRIAITGLGVISPIGIGKEAFWQGLLEGRSGVGRISRFDPEPYTSQIAAEVKDFRPELFFDKKDIRRMDRYTQFGMAASQMALEDAGLKLENEDPYRIGVVMGSGIGGIETLEEQMRILFTKGPGRVSPFLIPMMINNIAAGQIAISLGPKGPNFTVVTACASGAHALGEALRILRSGDADVLLAGGAEAPLTQIAFAGFCSMRAMSTRNQEPEKASRPFDRERDGFVIGEGAAMLVLETMEHAIKRGARLYGELCGYGCTADGYHITAPDPNGEGARRAMELALQDAGAGSDQVGYICAHGTSTDLNDRIETLAIKKVLGERAHQVPVSSIKSMIGHLMGASGAVGAAATALAVSRNLVPPTINYCNPDPDCDLDYVPNQAREAQVELALVNSFGFGGHNAVLAIKKFRA